MLNAKNAIRAERVYEARVEVMFRRSTSGNRAMRRAANAVARRKCTNTGKLDAYNEKLAGEVGSIRSLHPTLGYRSMSARRANAQVIMQQKYGVVR